METEEMLSGDVELYVGGEHYDLNLTIPATTVKPQRMLPVLQKLTNEIVARGIRRTEEAGKAISCKAACGACCRQPLLISEAEVFNLANLVESMPLERRRTIKTRFREGRKRFEKLDWFNRFDAMSARASKSPNKENRNEFIALLSEYIAQQVACPFLENESCSIYEDRPLICREYLVTSPAANCVNPRPESTAKIPISGQPSKAFASTVKTENAQKPSSLLLIRLLEFVELHTERFEEKTGPDWMDDFFGRLTKRGEPGMPEMSSGAT